MTLGFTPEVGMEVAVVYGSCMDREVSFRKIVSLTNTTIKLDNGDVFTASGRLQRAADAYRSPRLLSKERGLEIDSYGYR